MVHKGEFMGLPASGAEIWRQEDAVSLMQQLGALPVGV